MNHLLLAVIIFAVTYLIIISEKVHRTVIALSGASLMVLLGIINQHQAIEGVDFNTLGLLIGMMIVVGIARQSGVFQATALYMAKIGKGKPIPIFFLLSLTIGLFSAILDNVTAVLLMVPVTFVLTNNLNVKPYPYLVGTILFANIGGAATLIGDPPNILIGSAANLSFNDFLVHLAPLSLLVMAVTLGILLLWFRKDFSASTAAKNQIMQFQPKEAITDWPLLYKSLAVIGIIVLGFFTHSITHLEGATIAMGGAALLLLLTALDPDDHLKEIEWTTIFFFIGLFVLVSALEHVGAIGYLAKQLLTITQGNLQYTVMLTLWGSALLSAVVDNIPFVATMIPLVHEVGELTNMPLEPIWWALAIGADFGGNATLVGASANVVVSGMAEKQGQRIGFFQYMKIAVPLTLVALIISTAYLSIRYL